MQSNTTGTRNIAIGGNAYDSSDTENDNLAIGHNAMTANSSGGNYNIAIGNYTMDTLTSGDQNTGMGYQAMSAITSASNCTSIGNWAGVDITTGIDNTLIGSFASQQITDGQENTSVGRSAGTNITTGDYNLSLGALTRPSIAAAQGRITLGYNLSNPTDNSIRMGGGGNYVTNTYTSDANWAHSSDERLKENIEEDSLGLSFINDLRPVTFNWKKQKDIPNELKTEGTIIEKDTTTKMHGMIAQEVKSALDTVGATTFGGWKEDGSDGTQMISESMFIYPLINAIQELSAKNGSLETSNQALIARIEALENA